MTKTLFLRAGLDLLRLSGLTSVKSAALQGRGVIFCLHHVFPGGGRRPGFAPNNKLEIEPQFLEQLILLVRSHGYETLSLGDAVRHLKSGSVGSKPFAVFTLDDGYRDNLVFAKPVFDRLACPYTIFISPTIADGKCLLWWRLIEEALTSSVAIKCNIAGKAFDLRTETAADKLTAFLVLYKEFESMDQCEQRLAMQTFAQENGVDAEKYCRTAAMSWSEVKNISRNGLCTIGAHTINHYAVAKLSSADAERELRESKKVLSEILDLEVKFNAYPYGDLPHATARDFDLAAKAGYEASVTTRKGMVFDEHASHLQALPRLMVSGRYQELKFVEALLSGLPFALINGFRKVNAA